MSLVKYNNNSLSAVTAASSLPTGAMVLIKEQTASSSSTISFVDGTSDVVLDNTYPIYLFKFINIHPASDDQSLKVGFRDGSTAYDAVKTTTAFNASHNEGDTAAEVTYRSGDDLAQSTAFQMLSFEGSNDNDQAISGYMYLFDPSSTTFVKHFLAETNCSSASDQTVAAYVGGYCNVTAAIDAVQFKMSSGNMDAGTIKLYGIKDS